MNERKSECNESRLLAMMDDTLNDLESQTLFEHVSLCKKCQSRATELAGSRSDWEDISLALKSQTDQPGFSAPFVYLELQPDSTNWTKSFAKQLLSPPTHPEMLGRLGRYEIERMIGVGGMGVVFKAHDSELTRPVAIKVLAPYLAGSGAARQRFAREARAAAAVVHQHVVPIHNVETEREAPFLVMHYVAGESLQARIDREGPLELREILRIGMQVASGLSAAHQQGLVHRDIKPSNILLEEANVERALITDFGLARAVDDVQVTRTGTFMGTPQYMSPEQASGKFVDQKSDLFSLGSVLYTLCTGRAAFRSDSPLVVMKQINDESPTPIRELNSKIPSWLCLVIDKLMSKNKEQRYASAKEVYDLLKSCLGHVQQPDSVSLPNSVTNVPNQRWQASLRESVWIAGLMLAMVAISLWAGWEFFQNRFADQSNAEEKRVAKSSKNSDEEPEIKGELPSGLGERRDDENVLNSAVESTETEVYGHGFTRFGRDIMYEGRRIGVVGDFDKNLSRQAMQKFELARDVDLTSFKALNAHYVKDKNRVYFKYGSSATFCFVIVPNADSKSFEVVSQSLAKDRSRVWWNGFEVDGIDLSTLEVINPGFVWKDSHRVFYRNHQIEEADAATFEHLGSDYYRDRGSVYWSSGVIKDADPATFQGFGNRLEYGADRDSVWRRNRKLDNVDRDTFDPIHPKIFRDKNGVYADGVAIPRLDHESFRKVDDLNELDAALFFDGKLYVVYLPLYNDVLQVQLENGELYVVKEFWTIQEGQQAKVGEARATLTTTGWVDTKAPPSKRKGFELVLSMFQPAFEKAARILAAHGKKKITFQESGIPGNLVDISDDEKTLISYNRPGTNQPFSGQAELWLVENGEKLADLPFAENWQWRFVPGSRTRCVAVNHNPPQVRLWDFKKNEWYGEWLGHLTVTTDRHLRLPAFSPNGDTMVLQSDNSELQFWDLNGSVPALTNMQVASTTPGKEPSAVNVLKFSDDGQFCFAKTGNELTIWDSATGSRVAGPFMDTFEKVVFSAEQGLLVTSTFHEASGHTEFRVLARNANWQLAQQFQVEGKFDSAKWLAGHQLLMTGWSAIQEGGQPAESSRCVAVVPLKQARSRDVQIISKKAIQTVVLESGKRWIGFNRETVFCMDVGGKEVVWETPLKGGKLDGADDVEFEVFLSLSWIAIQQRNQTAVISVFSNSEGRELLHDEGFAQATFADHTIGASYKVYREESERD